MLVTFFSRPIWSVLIGSVHVYLVLPSSQLLETSTNVQPCVLLLIRPSATRVPPKYMFKFMLLDSFVSVQTQLLLNVSSSLLQSLNVCMHA